MTRKAAEKIAAMVVRRASAGSKEWAEAMHRELAYIGSDRRALAWALSGIRVLLSYRPKPLRTLGDLDAVAKAHANRRLHAVNVPWVGRNILWVNPLLLGLFAFLDLSNHHTAGHVMIAAGWLLLCPEMYLRGREPEVPDLDDRPGLIRFYVAELSAFSSVSSVWFWMSLTASLLLTIGYATVMSHAWAGVIGLPWLAVILIPRYRDRIRVAQVRALLGSLPGDKHIHS